MLSPQHHSGWEHRSPALWAWQQPVRKVRAQEQRRAPEVSRRQARPAESGECAVEGVRLSMRSCRQSCLGSVIGRQPTLSSLKESHPSGDLRAIQLYFRCQMSNGTNQRCSRTRSGSE